MPSDRRRRPAGPPAPRLPRPTLREALIASWALLGVGALLTQAVLRLAPRAVEPILDGSLGVGHWALYLAWVAFNGYAEGYRAFQLRFVPRVVARAFHLGRHPRPFLHVLLGPAYAMSLFHATRRSRTVAWVLLLAIFAVVVLVRQVPQPWRGIIDGGVVLGLVWGLVAMTIQLAAALRLGPCPAPDLPVTAPTEDAAPGTREAVGDRPRPVGVTAADA